MSLGRQARTTGVTPARWVPILAAILAVLPAGASEKAGDLEKWRLWNDCRPVSIRVEPLLEDAKGAGLTEENLRATVESRLRRAGVYGEEADAHAYVRVSVVGEAFSVRVLFRPRVYRPGLGSAFVATWGEPATGLHGHDIGHVLEQVVERADRFADNYLRVNAEACD